ncbi:MAG: hypothetical protein M1838_005169 [Thelocarpon superellum]|nr:MAG: hypothetical protein M1838_005169 [Thelocarpon superellum]
MLLGPLSIPRLCSSVAVYLVLLYMLVLFPTWLATSSSAAVGFVGNVAVVTFRSVFGIPDPRVQERAGAARRELEEEIGPAQFSDLADMADRMKAFIKLATAVQMEPLLDEQPLEDLLRQQFPWLNASQLEYTPWSRHRRRQHAPPSPPAETTGMVICVGRKNAVLAGHLIHTLRNVLNSTLPIEFAYLGNDDLPAEAQELLMAIATDVSPLDLTRAFPAHSLGLESGWGLKPFALLASRYQRVILADADVIFMQKPDDIFETQPGLAETGTLFWHDRAIDFLVGSLRDWLQPIMEHRRPSAMLQKSLMWTDDARMEMEAGVVCMDKGRAGVFMSAVLTAWMNSGDIRQDTYHYMWGDKETYWIAAELTSTPYHFLSDYAGTIGELHNGTTVCSTQVAHTDSTGQLLWINSSVRRDKYVSRELGKFTHWQRGMYTFPGNGTWENIDETVWCLTGHAPIPMNETGLDGVIKDVLREVNRVDGFFDLRGWTERIDRPSYG